MEKISEEQPALLPCPFCGTHFQRVHGQDDLTLRLCRVVCDECLYDGPNFKTRDMAIAWWNRRSQPVAEKASASDSRIVTQAWVSVYKVLDEYTFGVYESNNQAQKASAQDCLAIVKVNIDCERGEGIKK